MTQGERVREVRKALSMTLEKFGEKLGVGKTAISKIEKDERSLTEQMTKAICREFNVNYDWLTAEEGEMFTGLPQTILDELCLQYSLDGFDRVLVEMYLELTDDERKILKSKIRELFRRAGGTADDPDDDSPGN